MSASRLRPGLLCILLGGGLALAADDESAGEDEMPDMEFLEYLGMWEESDEEWVMLDETVVARHYERIDPAPEGEESTETYDEN